MLISLGCFNKIPQTQYLKEQMFISHNYGGWMYSIKMLADSVPGEDPFPVLLVATFLPCPYIVEREWASSSLLRTLIPTWGPHSLDLSQFSSITHLCLTLCDPMDHSMSGFPVHHQLPEFTQTHVHWVGDAIQPSHPLSSPSPPPF